MDFRTDPNEQIEGAEAIKGSFFLLSSWWQSGEDGGWCPRLRCKYSQVLCSIYHAQELCLKLTESTRWGWQCHQEAIRPPKSPISRLRNRSRDQEKIHECLESPKGSVASSCRRKNNPEWFDLFISRSWNSIANQNENEKLGQRQNQFEKVSKARARPRFGHVGRGSICLLYFEVDDKVINSGSFDIELHEEVWPEDA